MRVLSNLRWPQTPYGADKRPFGRPTHLLTGIAMQWVGDGTTAVPAGVAAAFLPVKRTQSVQATARTLHYGFWLAVSERDGDAHDLLCGLDNIIVQGRRHAAAIAWHSFAQDLHATQAVATERLPGFTALGAAWKDRAQRERGTAPVVDTAVDMGTRYPLAAEAAKAQGLTPDTSLTVRQDLLDLFLAHSSHEQLAGEEGGEYLVQQLAAGTLAQALSVALLGGRAMNRITWQEPFDVDEAIGLEAWHALPLLYDAEASDVSARSQ